MVVKLVAVISKLVAVISKLVAVIFQKVAGIGDKWRVFGGGSRCCSVDFVETVGARIAQASLLSALAVAVLQLLQFSRRNVHTSQIPLYLYIYKYIYKYRYNF